MANETESFMIKESASDPQQLYHIMVKTPTATNSEGEVTSWDIRWFLGDLHVKQLVVEGRGYTRDTLPALNDSSSTKGWDILQAGKVVSQGTFEEKTVSYEKNRINEADMFRVTKTVTIKALYENGKFAVGKTAFDAEDYTI
jgi:hypothetical protein